ncbi:MAG: hypothetical protein AAF267_04630 [Deinococcota bacterium]
MDDELFSQLLESLKQGRDILQGKIEPARVPFVNESETILIDDVRAEIETTQDRRQISEKP